MAFKKSCSLGEKAIPGKAKTKTTGKTTVDCSKQQIGNYVLLPWEAQSKERG